MSRRHRTQLSRRSKLSAYLESLECRQMLSATALAPAHPADQPAGLVVQPLAIPINKPAVVSANAVYTPLQIRMAYGVTAIPNQGQGTTIAIVDAYSDPYITSDVALFSSDFGLPQMDGVGGDPTFKILTPTGQPTPTPATPGGWDVEESLDVEYAHTIAPLANIDLVEAADTTTDYGDYLFGAEVDGYPFEDGPYYAKNLPGVDVISDSWGGSEFNGETAYDVEFNQPASHNPVTFTFSTGDSAAPGAYPAYAPNVVAAGGTSLYTASARGAYGSETAWSEVRDRQSPTGFEGGGGGVSKYESTPAFQSSNGVNYGARSIPDVSMDANPNTGVLVIDSDDNAEDFLEVGGTSLASPMWAGVIDLADAKSIAGGGTALSTSTVQSTLYGTYNSPNYSTDFHDITTGNNGFAAGVGYDLATGIGSPQAANLVPVLAAAGSLLPAASAPPILGSGGGGSVHVGGMATTPIVTSIPTESTIATPSVQGAVPTIATANVTTASLTAPLANATSTATASVSNSPTTPTPAPVNDIVTPEGSHGAVMTTTEFASNVVTNSVGADADGAVIATVDPSGEGSIDAAIPVTLSGNVSDLVFADNAAGSVFDRMAEAPAAVVSSTDESHTADIAMLAAAALAVYGYRSTFSRSEEKVRMVPVLA
jgi:subtilase family serine protease